MARNRSPQYPSIGLPEAIKKARLVWERDYQTKLPREVIAEHMGYKSLNGKSLGVISAVGKYGLLEGRGERTHITDLAVNIFAHEMGEPARMQAVMQAATEPSLFRDISEKFGGHSPSDQALKSYLITRGFILSAVDAVIQAYRDTEEFAKAEGASYDSADEVEENSEPKMQTEKMPLPVAATVPLAGVPRISMSDNGLEIGGGVITTLAQFEKLIRRLEAGKVLLEDDSGSKEFM